MTLVVTVPGREHIWTLVDRRLTVGDCPVREDARKLAYFTSLEGQALTSTDAVISYSGIGETLAGTEPCDWIGGVLRGRELTLNAAVQVLADAAKREIPRHLVWADPPGHLILITAFADDRPCLHTIGVELDPARRHFRFGVKRWSHREGSKEPPHVVLAGTGGGYLNRHNGWIRHLRRLIDEHARGKTSAEAVEGEFAKLNAHVADHVRSVGKRCIVVRRPRPGRSDAHLHGLAFFDGTTRETVTFHDPKIPQIARGLDLTALQAGSLAVFLKRIGEGRFGQPFTQDEENALRKNAEAVGALTPDGCLR